MSLLQALCAGAPLYRGTGVNHAQEPFHGELRVEALVGGMAVLLRDRAVLADGTVVHEACLLLGPGPDGRPWLWPVMAELDHVLPHAAIAVVDASPAGGPRVVFASGPRDDTAVFREEITLAFEADGTLTLDHAWGLPGEPFGPRSTCRLRPCADEPTEGPWTSS